MGRGGATQNAFRELAAEWEEENDVQVQHMEVADDAEMLSVLEGNPGEIDLCNPSPSGFARFRDADVLADLDYGEIPNYDNLDDPWHDAPFLEGHEDGVYRYISTQGLAYNTELVDEFDSWDEIERDEYDGQISLFAGPEVRFANAAAAAGIDVNEIGDDSVFDAIVEKAQDQHENVFQYWASGDQHMQFLREEQARISSAWGGRVLSLQDDGHPIEYFIPEEGAVTHSEGYAIPAASEKQDTSHELLNWLYERENLIELSTSIDYPIPIEDPPEGITQLPDYTEHPDDLTWIDWSVVLPHRQDIAQAFDEIRAS
ncbi:ABC transporter substrate-binding protein [Natrinema amylolyticum]|uniref:ABC transporter substrate-binding protein n=1 Tax=Natrinema amylolyticum TaxID=2878679 RepID=UPI001CFAE43C|nr:extracellular solute-binding protein [Natrinema amylolyticum]